MISTAGGRQDVSCMDIDEMEEWGRIELWSFITQVDSAVHFAHCY